VAGLAAAVSPLASRVVFLGVCLLAAFAPLAFGAVDAWARAIVLLVLALLGLVWVGDAIVRRRLLFRPTLLYAPLAGFLCWAALQLAFERTLYRHGTREELVWGAGLALAWTLAFNALNAEELRRLPLFLAIFGSALALFAILQGLAAPHDTIYLFRELAHGPTAYGPFINKNHYAGYMELLAPLPLALVMYRGVRREQAGLFLFMALVMMVSVALSLSRAGLVVLLLQLLLLGSMALAGGSRGEGRCWHALLFVLPALGGLGLWLGGPALIQRLGTLLRFPAETSLTVRLQVDRDAMAMLRAYPLWGSGLATFGAVYPRFKSFDDGLFWDHAHNDLAELLVEMGIPGALCLLVFLAGLGLLARHVAAGSSRQDSGRRQRPRGNPMRPGSLEDNRRRAVVAGIFAGCVGVLVHALVEFHFHIPATALTFAILYGVGLALVRAPVPARQDR